ncbi:hypothetical protein BD324DRAFT_584827 [Kockovaella imperatae]|uniref:Large ribosomal subunit protein bL32m n=1 Tax=Kockovaella imperatae TaxID=4999 RepID=A0A1Y1U801_9TREE|nr:hypothetical protein BD324DRAFT_584827 [Kockovaella imperatae]ORX33646.1 hypothetical protein BD324DRAFT_584827 [Kockovaella imperatae]
MPRLLTPYLRPAWSMPCEPSSSASCLSPSNSNMDMPVPVSRSNAIASKGWMSLVPGLESLLELIPPILLAVPKKKVSHRKKMQKLAGKGLVNKTNFKTCPACGNIVLMHNLCPNCFFSINKGWKMERRGESFPTEFTSEAGVKNASK